MAFVSFSFLIALAWTSLLVLCWKGVVNVGTLVFLEKKLSTFHHCMGLSYMAFIMLRYFPSIPNLFRALIMNRCWILSNAFSSSIEMIFLISFYQGHVSCVLICVWWTILVPNDKSHLIVMKSFCFLTSLLSIIALQWCVSFCFITKWISYTYTYVPISLRSCISLPPTLPIPPL